MTQPKGRLLSAFQDRAGLTQDRPIQDHGSGWSHLWDSGESALWDRGEASPALVDAVEQEQELLGPFTADGRRKKALVPGCGRGYDVVMLALHGFDAYGLEISGTAVQEAELYASSEMKTPSSYHYGTKKTQYGSPGSVTFIQGDFFSTNWENKGGINAATTFDVVYDYTFLCALHPDQRKDWAKRMGHVLKPGGLLVCLEFPLYKDPALPGPPWGLKGVHWDLLALGRSGVVTGPVGEDGKAVNGEGGEGEFHRVLYTQPRRSYEVAKGTDRLSVYERK